jgi:uncharacterized protein YdaL
MNLIKYDEGDFYYIDIDINSKTYKGLFMKIENESPIFIRTMDEYIFLKFRHHYFHTKYLKENIKNLEKNLEKTKMDFNKFMVGE